MKMVEAFAAPMTAAGSTTMHRCRRTSWFFILLVSCAGFQCSSALSFHHHRTGDNRRRCAEDHGGAIQGRRSWFEQQARWIASSASAAAAVAASATSSSSTASSVSVVAASGFAMGGVLGLPAAVRAASQARVKTQPGLEYLEPIYELQLSIDALQQGLESGGKESWPSAEARLEKFFGGGILSERNFYAGLGVQYMNQVVYEDAELPEYVRLDKEGRFGAMEDALKGLEEVKSALSAADEEAVRGAVANAKSGIKRWFAYVPEADRIAVAELYRKARQADTNRDGRLDETELSTLDDVARVQWKRRIQVAGG